VSTSYIPNRGDIVYLDFNPTKGHEQRGYRPALIISPAAYSDKSSLALFCPITSQQKGYPFEVLLPENLQTHGVILVDQIRSHSVSGRESLDWSVRQIKFVETVTLEVIAEVQAKITPLIY
jgi:mRNA interferase MazF